MKKIGTLVKPLTQQALVGDGYYIATLMLDWHQIVGEKIARLTRPLKIIFPRKKQFFDAQAPGNLYLQITHSAFATELSFEEPLMIERICVYFGKPIIGKITLKHGGKSFESLPTTTASPLITAPNILPKDILRSVNQVPDAGLQQALLSLANYMKFSERE